MKDPSLYKGSLTTIILRLLHENDAMYGYEITQRVKAITGGNLIIKEGALYPALHKLEAAGHLTATARKVDKRIRKYYALTDQGELEAVSKLEQLKLFIANMEQIITPKLSTI